jgi:hypothetical protein
MRSWRESTYQSLIGAGHLAILSALVWCWAAGCLHLRDADQWGVAIVGGAAALLMRRASWGAACALSGAAYAEAIAARGEGGLPVVVGPAAVLVLALIAKSTPGPMRGVGRWAGVALVAAASAFAVGANIAGFEAVSWTALGALATVALTVLAVRIWGRWREHPRSTLSLVSFGAIAMLLALHVVPGVAQAVEGIDVLVNAYLCLAMLAMAVMPTTQGAKAPTLAEVDDDEGRDTRRGARRVQVGAA